MSDEESWHSESEFYYPDVYPDFNVYNDLSQIGNNEMSSNNEETMKTEEEMKQFILQQKSVNTLRKTSSDMKCFYRYLKQINKNDVDILHLPASEFDHLLAKFYKDVRKINGDEYEPSSLTGLQRSIQRYISDSGSKINILKDDEFLLSRKVLEAKRKNLVGQGKGNRPNATRALSLEEENKLFQSGALSLQNPVSLQRAMWWILSLHFGFRARDESRKLCWGDISLQTDPIQDGREMLVWLCERGTKTRKGDENGHRRAFSPKAYATNTDRCPVMYYKAFKSHRPEEMNQTNAPFFLAVRHGDMSVNPYIWYKKAPLGKNEIGKFLAMAANEASLERIGSKVTNHSVRKTSISRLLDANTPENFVAQLSGHKNLQSLQSYKAASEVHQRQMSNILSGKAPKMAEMSQQQILPSTSTNEISLRNETATLALHNTSMPGINSIFSGASINEITGCQFQIFKGPVKIMQPSIKKKRRYVIESDDED